MTHNAGQDADDLVLSPSEQRAHNLALRASGTKKTSTQKSLASIALGFELFVVFLIGLTLFGLGVFDPAWVGLVIGGVACLLIIVALGMMRMGNVGIILGWIVHGLYFVGAFFLVPILFVGLIFTGLWLYCMWKGAQIDHMREARL